MNKDQDNILRLATKEGFVEAFWERLAACRREDPTVSQISVFEELNDTYEAAVGEPRFPSFNAFRMWRDRRTRSSQKVR